METIRPRRILRGRMVWIGFYNELDLATPLQGKPLIFRFLFYIYYIYTNIVVFCVQSIKIECLHGKKNIVAVKVEAVKTCCPIWAFYENVKAAVENIKDKKTNKVIEPPIQVRLSMYSFGFVIFCLFLYIYFFYCEDTYTHICRYISIYIFAII